MIGSGTACSSRYSARAVSASGDAQPRAAAPSMAARTAPLSGSPQRYSARKPQTSGAPPSHGSPAESHRAVTRARTGAVRSSAVSASEGAVTMPMRANGSPAAASDRQHTGSVSPSTRQSTTSGHAWRSCAQSERRKSSFIGAFRLLPPQTAVSNCRVRCISVSAFLSCPASRPRESPWRCRGRSRAAHSKTRSGRCAPRCRG